MLSRLIREPFNSISHGIGATASLLGLFLLLYLSTTPLQYFASFLYGVSLLLLYTSSSLYHGLNISKRVQYWLKRFDHASIYCLIAGTTTPIALLSLGGTNGWVLFGLLWGAAVLGIIYSFSTNSDSSLLRVTFYLVMGWMSLLFIAPLISALSAAELFWCVTGGVIYTSGAFIYAFDWPRLIPGTFESHELWHLFVLAGSISHFYSISVYTF